MKIYLADSSTCLDTGLIRQGLPSTHSPHLSLRILLSYHYFKNTSLTELLEKHFNPPYPEVFLDSGAFSAFSQNVMVDISSYCEYIHRYKHLIATYSNLDVIGSASGTLANQRRMEREGLHPLPVFHINEEWSFLQDYIEQYPYIALGGMVPYLNPGKRRILMQWLIKCFRLSEGRSVFHGFGCTVWNAISSFPWYSVDSSTWAAGFKYGKVFLFDSRQGKMIETNLGKHHRCYQFAHLFRAIGFDPADFAVRERNKREKNCAAAAISFLQAERWLERRHGPITIPERREVAFA